MTESSALSYQQQQGKISSCSTDDRSSEQLIFDPATYFEGLLADIALADSEIILEVYKFRLDQTGRKFVTALLAASERGVSIRVLIDGIGSYPDAALIGEQLDSENCKLRIFHPLPWDFGAYRRALNAGRWYSQLLRSIASINYRNHRKLCLIDRQTAWIGSFNICDEHYNRVLNHSGDSWHDTGVRLSGSELLAPLKVNFEMTWQRKTSRKGRRLKRFLEGRSILQRRKKNRYLLGILWKARKRIWITNAYFNPSSGLQRALKLSVARGIDVRILVPSKSDVFAFPSISRSYYVDLLNAGIRVFEFRHHLLHSKTMLIDDQVIVGSTNLNYRSFFHDLELDVLLSEASSIQCMQQKYLHDLENSREITLDHWQQYHWLSKVLGWISRLFRYWL